MDVEQNYKLIITYDGTAYGGWQVQPNAVTIQQLLQEALSTFFRASLHATGAGRTDAGVHAISQVAHFYTLTTFESRKLLNSLNGLLPKDIRVKSVEPVPHDFHARYSAKSKIYRYHLNLARVANPFIRHYSWHIAAPFVIDAAIEASQCFVGTHDFRSFANVGYVDSRERDTVRTIYRIDTVRTEDGLYFEFEGNGFLYKMVRNIVGCLVEVGLGKYSFKNISKMLAEQDRTAAGHAAPAKGLFLVEVFY
jgi:tRNA pseudouridine38-40 synthase